MGLCKLVTYNGTNVLIGFHYFAPDIKRDITSRVNYSVLSDLRLVQELLEKYISVRKFVICKTNSILM